MYVIHTIQLLLALSNRHVWSADSCGSKKFESEVRNIIPASLKSLSQQRRVSIAVYYCFMTCFLLKVLCLPKYERRMELVHEHRSEASQSTIPLVPYVGLPCHAMLIASFQTRLAMRLLLFATLAFLVTTTYFVRCLACDKFFLLTTECHFIIPSFPVLPRVL